MTSMRFTVKPAVTVTNQTIIVEGDDVTMLCSATGNPVPVLSWTLPTGISAAHPLVISNANRSDAGYYICSAENTLLPSGLEEINETDSVAAYLDVTCEYDYICFSLTAKVKQ